MHLKNQNTSFRIFVRYSYKNTCYNILYLFIYLFDKILVFVTLVISQTECSTSECNLSTLALFLHPFLHPQCRSSPQARTASGSNVHSTSHPPVSLFFQPHLPGDGSSGLQPECNLKHDQLGTQLC